MKIDPSSFEDDYVCTPNDPYEQVIKDFLVNQDRELNFLGFLQTLLPGVSAQQNAEAIPPVANIGAVTENQWTGICNSLLNIVRWFAPRVTGNHACKLTQIYSLSYIALSKRGQITDSKLGKVINRLCQGGNWYRSSDNTRSNKIRVQCNWCIHQSRKRDKYLYCAITGYSWKFTKIAIDLNAVCW